MAKLILFFKNKVLYSLLHDNPKIFIAKSKNFIRKKFFIKELKSVKDILFINGTTLNHPYRYRVSHQIEQLQSNNLSCDEIFYEDINDDLIKFYRGFVLFRCPLTNKLNLFIQKGKTQNKTFFYDIDDLVINEKYVRNIGFIKKMNKNDFTLYINGVNRNRECLKLCDYAITTTPTLKNELENYIHSVFINRNVVSEEMIHLSKKALENNNFKNDGLIYIGYLSGSITHNPDFELIKKPIIKILKEYSNVRLVITGLLDIPKALNEVSKKIIVKPFVEWRKLPEIISQLDINLAPIENTIFNRAKSENKWTEASLVKVATVASNCGAFSEIIKDGVTGLLCNNAEDWYKNIKNLIENSKKRKIIGNNAYQEVINKHSTIYTGKPLTNFINQHLKKNIAFVVPGTKVSGGINVISKHASVLIKNGIDVTLLSEDKPEDNIYVDNICIPVISITNRNVHSFYNIMVATLWTTTTYVKHYAKCIKKLYLVQNYETDFYIHGDNRKQLANSTYNLSENFKYITVSRWCQNWLKEKFGIDSKYCPNGIDLNIFKYKEKNFKNKIRIIIEGNSNDEYKNVDESFNITNQLNQNKYEIWYLSYGGGPKKYYKYNKFFNKIPYREVGKIYANCHILVKSSKVESFSYPPLEIMATGGIPIVAKNGGNVEYLNEKNSILYNQGEVARAVEYIKQVVNTKTLRDRLLKEAKKTVQERSWGNIEKQIISLYE